MDAWIDIAKWLAAAIGSIVVLAALVVGTLAWFLNHPD
jgi:hypothetical protein